jgi:hypothetical protein
MNSIMKPLRPLILLIVGFAALAYIGGILWAGIASIQCPKVPVELPDLVTQTITSIGAVLATNFGALFGISKFVNENRGKNPTLINIKKWYGLPVMPKSENKVAFLDKLPVYAAYLYFISLILALVFWGITGFSDQSAQILKNMTSTLIGAAAGVLAVYLNVTKPA